MPNIQDAGRSIDDIALLGSKLLRERIEPTLKTSDLGRSVAIDVDSGEFEIHDVDYTAIEKLRKKAPGAQIFLGRVGETATYLLRRLE